MVVRLLVVIGVLVMMRFCRPGVMGVVVRRTIPAVAVVVAVGKAVGMAVVMMVAMAVFLVAMRMGVLMLVLMLMFVGMVMGMFAVAHLRSPGRLLN
jgi:hypothetical protein